MLGISEMSIGAHYWNPKGTPHSFLIWMENRVGNGNEKEKWLPHLWRKPHMEWGILVEVTQNCFSNVVPYFQDWETISGRSNSPKIRGLVSGSWGCPFMYAFPQAQRFEKAPIDCIAISAMGLDGVPLNYSYLVTLLPRMLLPQSFI